MTAKQPLVPLCALSSADPAVSSLTKTISTCRGLTPAKIFTRNILGTAKSQHSISVASSICKFLPRDALCHTQIRHHYCQSAPGSVNPLDHQSRHYPGGSAELQTQKCCVSPGSTSLQPPLCCDPTLRMDGKDLGKGI